MIPEILLIRHAVARKIPKLTSLRFPLAKQAEGQIDAARKKIERYACSAVYASHLERSFETAKKLFPGQPIIIDPLVSEMNDGVWDSLDQGSIDRAYPFEIHRKKEQGKDYRPIGGENIVDLHVRAELFLFRLSRSHARSHRVAVVSHGWFMEVLLSRLSVAPCPPLSHCSVFLITARRGGARCRAL